jgi:hypothetical protein
MVIKKIIMRIQFLPISIFFQQILVQHQRWQTQLTSGSARLDQKLAPNVIERKRPERLTKTMANTPRYLQTDRRLEKKKDMLSSKKSTRSRKEIYLKTR